MPADTAATELEGNSIGWECVGTEDNVLFNDDGAVE